MTPQELKYSIICLALQGRLVEQNEDESPVDLNAIKAKKTEDYEFDIPENWKLAHIETVTNLIPSKQYQILESEVQQTGKYPVISQSKAYSIGFSDNSDRVYYHTYPAIVFGDHTTEVKYVEFDFVVGADGVKIFEPINEIITASFLFYVFQFYSKDLNKVGGYSRHYKFIKNKAIPLPPLAEQKRIVSKIEELLPLIDRYEQAWNKLEDFNKRFPVDMQKSILQMAIQGKLVEQRPEEGTGEELYQQIQAEKQALIETGEVYREKQLTSIVEDEIPFEIPDSWVWCKLGELTKTITKGSSPKWQGVSYTDKEYGILFITSENVGVEQLLLSKEKYVGSEFNTMHPASVLQKGDLLTNIVGASIGRTAIFDLDVTGANINQAVCIIRLVNQDVSEYILKFLNSTMAVEMMSQKSVDSARANLSLTSVTNLLIPLPPLAEQKRIVAKLEEILPLCERLSSPMISTLTKTISSNDNKSNITRVEQLPKKEYIVRQAARSFGETSPNDTADLIKYYIERKNNDKKT
ncbi:MAG: restriction endonuclease subunit S [Oscillospiraceae bacterium]|nr:restriction endonuclease subunit S [Oscillospiraceae bacterium]